MNKSILKVITVLICLAFITILSLVTMVKDSASKTNGFTRDKSAFSLKKIREISIESNYRIAGITSKHFLFTGMDPQKLIRSNFLFTKWDTIHLPMNLDTKSIISFSVIADSTCAIVYTGNNSSITYWIYDTIASTVKTRIKLSTSLFTKAVDISKKSVIVRGVDSDKKNFVLMKFNKEDNLLLAKAKIPNSFEGDGFSADGMLAFDAHKNRIIYSQFYQNKFFCLDTNLNFIYTGKTIDTTNSTKVHGKITVNRDGNGNIKPSAPLRVVNRYVSAYNGNLYILSNLKADNDLNTERKDYSCIDIYNIDNGTYISSYYLPDENRKAISFGIYKNFVLATYSKFLVLFKID